MELNSIHLHSQSTSFYGCHLVLAALSEVGKCFFKVWGCRGSIPAPATLDFDTRRYGGQTTCFEIRTRCQGVEKLSIIDMGTAIKALGDHLIGQLKRGEINRINARAFITHIHLEHNFGMGFSSPLFITGQMIEFFALEMPAAIRDFNNQLASLIDGIRFPRHPDQLPSIASNNENGKTIHDVKFWEILDFETVRVKVFELNHPSGCAGWHFRERAPDGTYTGPVIGIGTNTEHFSITNPNVQNLSRDADFLILDGMYEENQYYGTTPDRTNSKIGWGHSTPRASVREVSECGAKRLGITHHDPDHDDRQLSKMEARVRRYNRRLKKPVPEVFFLREGMSIDM
ncbi:MAG: hypothetical protein JRG97_07855 [Deltaproteobacteria bacterium]|nr:hypothetical protein [Deltaproteobacteria bacterium]MBW2051912.1 hypothetical protein [Deltaproteobacteria bacterium]MBW2140972.1 hypothetical protein [Deltaproteobacteria bacterium]MBW2322720.1 hypothetical protein [Deltaproteobacteria bacterium]